MKNTFLKNTQKGFTLIELVVVLIVLFLLLAILLPALANLRNEQGLKAVTEDVVATLNDARTRTVASLNSSQYGVHVTSGTLTIFTGSTYSSTATANEIKTISPAATISTISLTGSGSNIIFDRLTGATSQNGTLTVQAVADTSRTRTVTISKTGVVSSN